MIDMLTLVSLSMFLIGVLLLLISLYAIYKEKKLEKLARKLRQKYKITS